jgi:hypothetical protein
MAWIKIENTSTKGITELSEDYLKKQILEKHIKEWIMHKCSLCNYKCGYIFKTRSDQVAIYYDNGCYK